MKQLVFSPGAMVDIEEIWDYTAVTWGYDRADAYLDDIQNACEGLAGGKRRGRKVDIRDGYMKHPVGRHFIFFRASPAGIEVVRILHQSMDIERHL